MTFYMLLTLVIRNTLLPRELGSNGRPEQVLCSRRLVFGRTRGQQVEVNAVTASGRMMPGNTTLGAFGSDPAARSGRA